MDGLGYMVGSEGLGAYLVGNGAGDLEDAVVGAGAEIQIRHRRHLHVQVDAVEVALISRGEQRDSPAGMEV